MDILPTRGPQIGRFMSSKPKLNVKFLRQVGEGGDSWVWKVNIDGGVYALKMFKPYTAQYIYPMQLERFRELGIEDETAVFHALDPFANECRAYGRLEETNNASIGVACYGYLLLSPDSYEDLDFADFRNLNWVEFKDGDYDPRKPKAPIRTLVKEYIESYNPFTPDMIQEMLRNLKLLHKHGIVHRDIRADNYIEGQLVDFSTALTAPHFLLDMELGYNDLEEIYSYEVEDGYDFDSMIDRWSAVTGMSVWERFLPNFRYRHRLRSKETGEKEKANSSTADRLAARWETYSKLRDQIKWHAADYDWNE
ncbi:kinetochore Sim4 complex subunit FTA2-domain-containing protein [Xylaria sp. FL0043]|nr:kinetochore Sim4 complex subunit FTA2-domain-containing protein [Xylaria sp. FL0043]